MIVSPALTISSCGSNRTPSILTSWITGLGPAAAPSAGTRPVTDAAVSRMRRNLTLVLDITSLLTGERSLDPLGVIQMRDECRPDLNQQGLQLRIRCIRDQHLVDRGQDLLVVGHLVIEVGLVEGGTLEHLEIVKILFTTRLETLAGL